MPLNKRGAVWHVDVVAPLLGRTDTAGQRPHRRVTDAVGHDGDGLVAHPVTLSWADFHALPQVEDVSDFHCVTTWSKYDCRWGGVALTTLYELARPAPEARFVYFSSYDGYSTNVPLERCLDDDTLVATSFEGAPVALEHGGPARVIIPKLYAWKGAKFVQGITFLAQDKLGFWEVHGYSNHADPWKEERYA